MCTVSNSIFHPASGESSFTIEYGLFGTTKLVLTVRYYLIKFGGHFFKYLPAWIAIEAPLVAFLSNCKNHLVRQVEARANLYCDEWNDAKHTAISPKRSRVAKKPRQWSTFCKRSTSAAEAALLCAPRTVDDHPPVKYGMAAFKLFADVQVRWETKKNLPVYTVWGLWRIWHTSSTLDDTTPVHSEFRLSAKYTIMQF